MKVKRPLIFLLSALGIFLLGAVSERAGILDELYASIRKIKDKKERFEGLTPVDAVALRIEIREEDFNSIRSKRALAINDGILLTSSEDYVPCRVYHKRDTAEAKIRLKGDYSSHFETALWSYRIKLRNNDAIMGMNRFSIHHPRERNFVYEWLFHRIMKKEGIIALNYDFADVYINNELVGLYAIEEHFEKQMLENNQRREGPILKFDETALWQHRLAGTEHDDQAFLSSRIDVFKPNYTRKDSSLKTLTEYGMSALNSFRAGNVKASEIFNIDQTAKFYALSDILGAHHVRHFHNLRFYLDPISGLFEPIAFDADAGQIIGELLAHRELREPGNYNAFSKLLFSDPEMQEAYYRMLHKYSDLSFSSNWVQNLDEELNACLYLLYKSYPDFNYKENWLKQNQKKVQSLLHPPNPVEAFIEDGNKINATNLQGIPVRLHYLVAKTDTIRFQNNNLLASYNGYEVPEFYDFILRKTITDEKYRLYYTLLGSDSLHFTMFSKWAYPSSNISIEDGNNMKDFDFLKIDEQAKTVLFSNEECVLKKNLLIPQGYTVYGQAPLNISLSNGASIISKSPLIFKGEENAPMRISSDTEVGGISVIDAHNESIFENVHFSNLGEVIHGKTIYTGAINILKGKVSFNSCFVEDMYSEDGINIINAEFRILNTSVISCRSDGIDVDFSVGLLKDVNIRKCHNDGLDISGSVITLENFSVRQADDKGISIGEGSRLNADIVYASDCIEAIAVKDNSVLNISELRASRCATAIAVFIKKKAFGPGYAKVGSLLITETDRAFRIEDGCFVVYEGDTIREM